MNDIGLSNSTILLMWLESIRFVIFTISITVISLPIFWCLFKLGRLIEDRIKEIKQNCNNHDLDTERKG